MEAGMEGLVAVQMGTGGGRSGRKLAGGGMLNCAPATAFEAWSQLSFQRGRLRRLITGVRTSWPQAARCARRSMCGSNGCQLALKQEPPATPACSFGKRGSLAHNNATAGIFCALAVWSGACQLSPSGASCWCPWWPPVTQCNSSARCLVGPMFTSLTQTISSYAQAMHRMRSSSSGGNATPLVRCCRTRESSAVCSTATSAGGRCCTSMRAWACECRSAVGRARPRPGQGSGTCCHSSFGSGQWVITNSANCACAFDMSRRQLLQAQSRASSADSAGVAPIKYRAASSFPRRRALYSGVSSSSVSLASAVSGATASSRRSTGTLPPTAAECTGSQRQASGLTAAAGWSSSSSWTAHSCWR